MPDDLEGFMQEMERKLLIKALKENGNNKTKAAESLGISFRAMRYKLKKLGID
ncbi:helix-turn-helix domain-containing protein [Dichelobacter nodosus]|nr:helix-turn-helix domain-containing protein [Dichelobacter nodosus]